VNDKNAYKQMKFIPSEKNQVVYGEVYVPGDEGPEGNSMTPETIEEMAHDFMEDLRLTRIDNNNDGDTAKGVVVESFIVRKEDPDFAEGAWVVGVKIRDKEIWESIERGDITGFSIIRTQRNVEIGRAHV
jgi:hypothetical protein